jgi:uncharacterized protein (TIGR04255 family)
MNPSTHRIRYRKPPVTEALCEFYFAGSVYDATLPGQFYHRIAQSFPEKQEQQFLQVQFPLSPNGPTVSAPTLQPRMQFRNPHENRLVQLAPDLLVVNQLAPYVAFEKWEPDILKCLSIYHDLASPQGIVRLGMRYINVVDLEVGDGPHYKLEDYFRVRPELPDTLVPLGTVLLRLELLFPDQHKVLLTLATTPPRRLGAVSYVFDLYDIMTVDEGFGMDAVPTHLAQAHVNLGKAFEESLTPALKNTFEPETTTP